MTRSRRAVLRTGATALAALGAGCSGGLREGGEQSAAGATKTRTPPEAPDALAPLLSGGTAVLRPPAATGAAALATEGCGPEPALSAAGRELARTVGDVLRGFDVPLREVQASQYCRCLDTARLAFGRVTPRPTTGDDDPLGDALSSAPARGSRLAVGTGETIEAAVGLSLEPGELAVFGVGNGDVPAGRVAPSRWTELADQVGAPVAGRGTYSIPVGSDVSTPVHRYRSGTEGPTAVVVAGIHGDEAAGYRAARRLAEWTVDAGTLVVLPAANKPAVDRDSRYGPAGHDMNRRFLLDEPATSPLARDVWDTVVRHDPDVVVDLHSSKGFYGPDFDAVGQAVFHSPGERATQWGNRLVSYLNRSVLPPARRPEYDYVTHRMTGEPPEPRGMLVTRVYERLGVPTFLHEVTEHQVTVGTTTDWTVAFSEKLLALAGLTQTDGVTTRGTGT